MSWLGNTLILAQADSSDIVLVTASLIVLVLLGAMAVFWLRRRMHGEDAPSGDGGGFSLGDLRKLLKEGKITPEEFDRAKVKAVEAAQRQAEKASPQKPATKPPSIPPP
jgi:hypothetical protein